MICQGRLFGSLLLVVLLSACGGAHSGWSAFPVPIYADPVLVSSATALSDFNDGMAFWEAKAGKKLFDYKGTWQGQSPPYAGTANNPSTIYGNVIFFPTTWTLGQNVAGLTTVSSQPQGISVAMIAINPNLSYCTGDCVGETNRTSERKDFTHELGHFLGLQHVQDINNIMYPVLQPGGSLNAVSIDTGTLLQLTSGS